MVTPMLSTPSDLPPLLGSGAVRFPVSEGIKERNVLFDQLFYDVSALSKSEFDYLLDETNLEGSILVVQPGQSGDGNHIRKFAGYEELRAAPGRLLTRFCIAGVGSSDVGSAAFARNLADHYDEPVGAIVAGYGVADLLAEGLGGWFVLGAGNLLMKIFHDQEAETKAVLEGLNAKIEDFDQRKAERVAARITGSPDSTALLRLLLDEDRQIKTVLGHSKGCLSIAWALEALVLSGADPAIEKAKTIRVITTGAAVDLPNGFDNCGQYLGSLDAFGAMNSRGAGSICGLWFNKEITWVPNAWHHVNTDLAFHMSVRNVLERDDACVSCI
jgi:hypothetical protein